MDGPQAGGALDALAAIAGLGVVVTGPDGALQYASPAAASLLGCGSPDALKAAWSELRPRLDGAAREPGKGPPGLRIEVRALAGGAQLLLLKDADRPSPGDEETVLASEARLLPYAFAVMGHDVKASLNAMQLTLELLDEPGRTPADSAGDRRRRYVTVLKEELQRLDRMLQTFFSPPSAPAAREAVALPELVREVGGLLLAQARRQRIGLRLPEGGPVTVAGRRRALRQALLNIGATVLSSADAGDAMEIDMVRAGGTVELGFRAPGVPLPQGWAAALYALSPPDGPDALALYAAQVVARAHGGQVTEQDERILLTLPVLA